jgi:NOL1/NOP2/fmu family ribosome biogenesis protein
MSRLLTDSEERELFDAIRHQFGCEPGFKGRLYAREGRRSLKVFQYTGELLEVKDSWLGLHVGDLSEGVFTPSIEGAGLIGRNAAKNVVEVTREQGEQLFKGESVEHEPVEGIVLLKLNQRVVCPARHGKKGLEGIIPDSRKTTR